MYNFSLTICKNRIFIRIDCVYLYKFIESMLNRRILRVKAFKALYAYAENPGMSLADTEAYLCASCEATRELYLFLLSSIVPLTGEAEQRIRAAQEKFNPTEEERNPNLKFVNNSLTKYFAQDPDFVKIIGKKKYAWDQYDVFLYNLYETVSSSPYFRKYMESGESSLKEDAALWVKIFENCYEDNNDLAAILEDLSMFWSDDLGYALLCCVRTLQEIGNGGQWKLPPLYQSEMPSSGKPESDKAFVTNLLRKAYARFSEYMQMIDERTPKWDLDRICVTDLCLIACGLAESEAFPEVSPRIIINEYVEISKYYSTPVSRQFVNGLLDRIINKKD